MSPFDGDSNTIGIQYCPGYVDKSGQWRAGFYCPPKSQGRKMYCCGSTVHKYCCGSKEENELFGSNVSYISSSTMFTVTIVTFIFAVMLTVLGFVCCRKFFKRHLGGLEIEETHSYRMSTGHGDVNQESNCVGSTILTNSSVPIQPSATTTSINLYDLTETSSASPYANLMPPTQLITANGTRLDSYLPTISSYINPPTIGFIDPPPPYQVTPNYYSDHNNINNNNNSSNNNNVNNNNSVNNQTSQQHQQPLITANNNHNVNSFTNNNTHNDRTSNNNRIFSMLGASYRRDIIHPCEGQKRLWRTMSQ